MTRQVEPRVTPANTLPDLTPAQARQVLADRINADWLTRIDTEIITTSSRAARRWITSIDQTQAIDAIKRDEIQTIINLPDHDLTWLLTAGWRPE